MDAQQIKQRIEQATGATDVETCGIVGGDCHVRFTSPNGLRVLRRQLIEAGFGVGSDTECTRNRWTMYLWDAALLSQPGDGLPASDVKEGGDVLGDEDVLARADWDALMPTEQYEAYLTLDKLYNNARSVVEAIPECPQHGYCTPHAREWIAQSITLRAQVDNALATVRQKIAACDARLATLTNEPAISEDDARYTDMQIIMLQHRRAGFVVALAALESEPTS